MPCSLYICLFQLLNTMLHALVLPCIGYVIYSYNNIIALSGYLNSTALECDIIILSKLFLIWPSSGSQTTLFMQYSTATVHLYTLIPYVHTLTKTLANCIPILSAPYSLSMNIIKCHMHPSQLHTVAILIENQ